MAKKAGAAEVKRKVAARVTRPGVHAKTKHDYSKAGKHWSKPYRGQGK